MEYENFVSVIFLIPTFVSALLHDRYPSADSYRLGNFSHSWCVVITVLNILAVSGHVTFFMLHFSEDSYQRFNYWRMEWRAKASPLKLVQRSDGPHLTSWVVIVLWSFSSGHENGINPDARNPLPLLSHEGTSLAWSIMALQSHPCKSGISLDSSSGVYMPKASFCLGFTMRGPTGHGRAATTCYEQGPCYTFVTMAERAEHLVFSHLHFNFHMSLSPRGLSSSRSYSMVHGTVLQTLNFKLWLGWVPHTPWKHLHLNLKGWVSDN